MVAPVGGTKVEKSGGVRASSPKNIELLEVTGEGVQLFEKPANNPKDKFAKGTILEQKRLSSDKKWILVKVQGKNDEGWISASQVRSKETPKPSVAKEPAKTVPQASPIAAPVPAASTETPLQILLKSGTFVDIYVFSFNSILIHSHCLLSHLPSETLPSLYSKNK